MRAEDALLLLTGRAHPTCVVPVHLQHCGARKGVRIPIGLLDPSLRGSRNSHLHKTCMHPSFP